MKIHEYQAKAILKKYGVAVARGEMATRRRDLVPNRCRDVFNSYVNNDVTLQNGR